MKELTTVGRVDQLESKILEELVIQKTIIPSRAIFFHAKSFSSNESSDDTSISRKDLLTPLAKAPYAKSGGGLDGVKNLDGHLATSLLFHIAVKSVPRDNPKQRSVEDSWLQELFDRLVQPMFHISAPNIRLMFSAQHISTVNQMLREVADHNVRISISKLGPLIGRIMSYPDGALDAAGICEIIGLCIVIDANIFLAPAPSAKDGQRKHQRVPNHLLAALLRWITDSAWKKSLEVDPVYEVKLSKVVLPLADAFEKARNLLGFVSFWQEQLSVCQVKHPEQLGPLSASYRPRTVWEDERLLQRVGRLAESSLTVGQINSWLVESCASVESHLVSGSDGFPKLVAGLIVLDCASAITLNNAKLAQIADTSQIIYRSTLNWLLSEINWPTEHVWRLWRILIAFTKDYYIETTHSDTRYLEQQVTGKAVKLTLETQLRTAKNEEIRYSYAEELYAFAFVISQISEQRKSGEDNERPYHDLMVTVIEWISEYGARECNNGTQSHNDSTEKPQPVIQWNGQSDGVIGLDILHLGYLTQILVVPGSLK